MVYQEYTNVALTYAEDATHYITDSMMTPHVFVDYKRGEALNLDAMFLHRV